MQLGKTNYFVTFRKNGIWQNIFGKESGELIPFDGDTNAINICKRSYSIFKNKTRSEEAKMDAFFKLVGEWEINKDPKAPSKNEPYLKALEELEHPKLSAKEIKANVKKFMNFFSEFAFEPNFRFVNSFARACLVSQKAAQDYIINYFDLTDSLYAEAIKEKVKCDEFKIIAEQFKLVNTEKKINKRFKLYYGSQGTGKTTTAAAETNNNVIVCNSSMLPSDLMEDFKFEDGKAAFKPSALQEAMVNGTQITLDEINLLPFESLRFLQGILDDKQEILYKGNSVKIADGFKIVGTMNLYVNGTKYALPEPLVDRCEEIKQYKLTAEDLVGAL